jgi:glutaredoxin-related protein
VLGPLSDKLRAFAHDRLQGAAQRPAVRRAIDFASTVNDLLGKPIGGRGAPASGAPTASVQVPSQPPVQAAVQAPVMVYFDGKDQRSKAKIEELLNARDITFKLLDVTDDEAERSWVVTAAKSDAFPIVVVAGTPLGGLHELVQLDVQGELKRRVFGQ